MDDAAKARLVENIAGHVGAVVSDEIRERAFKYWDSVHEELGARVREAYKHNNEKNDEPTPQTA